MATERKKLPVDLKLAVLTEAGFRCAVPTCRNILAIDLHHIESLENGGKDGLHNLIALCPTCHALFHRGTIPLESIRSWKAMLVALSNAFDKEALDDLIFLDGLKSKHLPISADAVLKFRRLIAAGLASFERRGNNSSMIIEPAYGVFLTPKGEALVSAWKAGDRELLGKSLSEP